MYKIDAAIPLILGKLCEGLGHNRCGKYGIEAFYMTRIQELVKKYDGYIRSMRQKFHAHPELAFEEQWTTKQIAAELEQLGIPYTIPGDRNTGIVAVLKGTKPGRGVALRADMDGLPVQEENEMACRSRQAGRMHACGHDGHMAVLLGAAHMLTELRDEICGTVYFVFQPAEECGQGARYLMEQGDWFSRVDNVFGGHLWMAAPAGKVSVEAGPRMAAGDCFRIVVEGRGGHGARPEQTVDALVTAAAIVMSLQTVVARHFSPMDQVLLTIGTFHSGHQFNVIPGEAVLEGTTRYFDLKLGDELRRFIGQLASQTAAAYGASVHMEYRQRVPSVVANEAASSRIAGEAVRKVLGDAALAEVEPTMIGEDFSYYLEKKPGCFAFFGAANPEKGIVHAHHNSRFDIDEDVLAGAAGIYAQYALDWLRENSGE